MDANNLREGLRKIMEATPEGICCVCGHKLDDHIDESEVWRCHHLALDFYQCECVLRKGRAAFATSPLDILFPGSPISSLSSIIGYYDLKRRITQRLKESEEE